MSQDLVSTAPGVYAAMLGLVQAAAAQQNPAVEVFPFEVGPYEPGSYVTVQSIENHQWDPETIGTFSQKENYSICGTASVFTGDTVTSGTVATDILTQTYALFQTVVMTPLMSNRTIPILGGPVSVYQMLPGFTRYAAAPGDIGGNPGGWVGVIEFSYSFDALVTPA